MFYFSIKNFVKKSIYPDDKLRDGRIISRPRLNIPHYWLVPVISKHYITQVRTLDNDTITSSSFAGSTALSGVFTGSKYDFIMGATSGTTHFRYPAQGFFGEFRYWNRALSGSEMDAHAYHFESIGVSDPLFDNSRLRGHWALNEDKSTDSVGVINTITDLSRNNNVATGSQFATLHVPYKKFLMEYVYLSPTIDLKWTDNKIRIRDKTALTINDVAKDTSEISLEFNLIDALNEDISKIFSGIDVMNNVIGKPVNKYRDEYNDLESYRRVYFERLTTSLNFTNFFKLFRWFDRKISDSIKQLLPARSRFIGGQQVVESHFLERNKYGYKYPIFRTPKTIPEASATGSRSEFSGVLAVSLEGQALGTYANSARESTRHENLGAKYGKPSVCVVEGAPSPSFVSHFSDGDERVDRIPSFYRRKISGDTADTNNNANNDINLKNHWSRRKLAEHERDNKDGLRSGSFISSKLGNAFVISSADSSKDSAHYFTNYNKHIQLSMRPDAFEEILLTSSIQNAISPLWSEYGGALYTTRAGNAVGSMLVRTSSSFSASQVFYQPSNSTISSVCITPSGTIFVGEISSANVWKIVRNHHTGSVSTWTTVYTGVMTGTAGDVQRAPTLCFNPITNTLFAGGGEGKGDAPTSSPVAIIRSSSDQGASWADVLVVSGTFGYIRNICFYNSGSNGVLYASGRIAPSGAAHTASVSMWKSTNNGAAQSWTEFQNVFSGGFSLNEIACMKIDVSGAIYVVGASGNLDASTYSDAAIIAKTHVTASENNLFISDLNTFMYLPPGSKPRTGWPFGLGDTIAISPLDPNYIVVVCDSFNGPLITSSSFGIRRTLDGGTIWHDFYQKSNILQSASLRAQSAFVDTAGNVYAQHDNIVASAVATATASISLFSPSDEFVFSGSDNASNEHMFTRFEFLNKFYDNNGVKVDNNDFVRSNFGVVDLQYFQLIEPRLSFEISSSIGLFNNTRMKMTFQDKGSSAWGTKKQLNPFGYYTDLKNGFYRFNTSFISGSKETIPLISFNRTGDVSLVMSCSFGVHVIRNVNLTFKQQLTDDGVKKYAQIDNQHNKNIFSYLRRSFFRKSGSMIDSLTEFPHAEGFFQMPNIITGTKSSGRVGNTEDSIIRIKHFGSFVKVLWPKQDSQNFVKGYGDFSYGQKPGKLDTNFSPGDFVDVTLFDHLSLYCYVLKNTSGTLEDILVKVERRPLKDLPFTIDQTVTYENSGSYATEAIMRDLVFRKPVDYGDMSIREIGYPIDVPLENTREVRISCRQRNGQANEENRNLIVWGRFIKSDEET